MSANDDDNRKVFLNLPVSSIEAARAFYTSLGFEPNPQFSDATANCIIISPTIYVMLLSHARYTDFLPAEKGIPDAKKTAQILICITCQSKAEVDSIVEKAVRAGGRGDVSPKQEMGGMMYGRSFEDLDGHNWEVVWMDPNFGG